MVGTPKSNSLPSVLPLLLLHDVINTVHQDQLPDDNLTKAHRLAGTKPRLLRRAGWLLLLLLLLLRIVLVLPLLHLPLLLLLHFVHVMVHTAW
jgi:hypothetical protein